MVGTVYVVWGETYKLITVMYILGGPMGELASENPDCHQPTLNKAVLYFGVTQHISYTSMVVGWCHGNLHDAIVTYNNSDISYY